jgi:hypothetical protein
VKNSHVYALAFKHRQQVMGVKIGHYGCKPAMLKPGKATHTGDPTSRTAS